MSRQIQPILLGVLKNDENGDQSWIKTLWRLPSGGTRIIAQRGTVVAKNDKTGDMFSQMKLVDVNGKPV